MSASRTPTSPSAGAGASAPIGGPSQAPIPQPRPEMPAASPPAAVSPAADPAPAAPEASAPAASTPAASNGAASPTSPSAGADASKPADSAVNSCPVGCPRCKAKITKEQLKEIFTSASDDKLTEVANAFNEAFEKFEINTCLRKAHFFAQVREEVGPTVKSLAENMNYSVDGLKGTFKYFRDNPQEAALYGRSKGQAANQEAIGNRAYANRLGNGDAASGDGWKYRGKGFIQLTGRSNYQNVQNEIDRRYPGSGVDIMANEGDILTVKGGMISAMGFWTLNNLNTKADMGARDADVDRITAVVNKHTHSYAERKTHFKTTKKVFKVPECPNWDGDGQNLLDRLKSAE